MNQPAPSSLTVGAVIVAYLEDLAARTGEAHVTRCRFSLDRILREIGDGPVDELIPQPVVAYRAKRLREGIARATVNKDLGTLQAALSWATEVGMIQANPIRGIRALPVREADLTRAKRALTDAETERFLDAARARDAERTRRGVRQYPLWLALLDTGARRGEVLALRWVDVDLGGAAVAFRAKTTKAGRSRVVPIDPILVDELRRLRAEHEAFLGEDPGEEAPVFLSPHGEPWTPNTVRNTERYFHSLRERASIPRKDSSGRRVTIHALRHTFGTVLARSGARPEVVAKLMGHSDTKVTLAYYVHIEEEDLRAARAGRWSHTEGGWSQMRDLNPRPLLYESTGEGPPLWSAVVAAAQEMVVEPDSDDDCSSEPEASAPRPARPPGEPRTGPEDTAELVRLRVLARPGSPLWWALMETPRGDGEEVARG